EQSAHQGTPLAGGASAMRQGYADVRDLWQRSGLGRAALERLAAADALRSLDQSNGDQSNGDQSNGGLDRRRGLWALKALGEAPLPLFAVSDRAHAPHPDPLPARGERESLRHLPRKPSDDLERSHSWVPSPRQRGEGQGEGLFD